MDSPAAIKRPYATATATDDDDDGHVSKRIKAGASIESPALYSEQVKKKLAAASRTGQASSLTPTPIPSSRYIGWPITRDADPVERGPIHGTRVNILDAVIDVADFECEQMRDPRLDEPNLLNASRPSIIRSIFHFRPVPPPDFPPLQEALQSVDLFLDMNPYVPVVHKPSFKALIARYYEQPDGVSRAELMQLAVVQAVVLQQSATRNLTRGDEDYRKAHHYFHFALSLYREIYADASLEAMQALALLCIYLGTLPQPGETWSFSQQVLLRLIELHYHRNPNKIALPAKENNALGKEMRIRVFHSVLTICVLTGCRVGLPAPWQFQRIDVPLPAALRDEEISPGGISTTISGLCDFCPCLQLSKLLPLYTELHNNITATRRPPAEYVKVIEALDTKILAWRQDWDASIKHEPRTSSIDIATFLMDHWTAEFQITLHHPVCCTSTAPEVLDRNLEICHAAAKKLLQSFHHLNREYKGVDFTCHSLVGYAMGFGIALHVYRKKLARVSKEKFENICNELNGWLSLMAYFDLVLRTGYLLQGIFRSRVQQLEEDYRTLLLDTPVTSQPAGNGSSFQNQMANGLVSPME
ncbi:hypothetical protein DV737_g5282, partial [Chaetothyriales sp. CBS 132003]